MVFMLFMYLIIKKINYAKIVKEVKESNFLSKKKDFIFPYILHVLY